MLLDRIPVQSFKIIVVLLLVVTFIRCVKQDNEYSYVINTLYEDTDCESSDLISVNLRYKVGICIPKYDHYTVSNIFSCAIDIQTGDPIVQIETYDGFTCEGELRSTLNIQADKCFPNDDPYSTVQSYSCVNDFSQMFNDEKEYVVFNQQFVDKGDCNMMESDFLAVHSTQYCLDDDGIGYQYSCNEAFGPNILIYEDISCSGHSVNRYYLPELCTNIKLNNSISIGIESTQCYNSKSLMLYDDDDVTHNIADSKSGYFELVSYSSNRCKSNTEVEFIYFPLHRCITLYLNETATTSFIATCGDTAYFHYYDNSNCEGVPKAYYNGSSSTNIGRCSILDSTFSSCVHHIEQKNISLLQRNELNISSIIANYYENSCEEDPTFIDIITHDICYDSESEFPYKFVCFEGIPIFQEFLPNSNCQGYYESFNVSDIIPMDSQGCFHVRDHVSSNDSTPGRFGRFTCNINVKEVMISQDESSLSDISQSNTWMMLWAIVIPCLFILIILLIYYIKNRNMKVLEDIRYSSTYNFQLLPLYDVMTDSSISTEERLNMIHRYSDDAMSVFDLALQCNLEDVDMIEKIMTSLLPYDAISMKPVSPDIHRYAWIKLVQQDKFSQTVTTILETYPNLRLLLASCTNAQGHSAIDIASNANKIILRDYCLFMKKFSFDGNFQKLLEVTLIPSSTQTLVVEAIMHASTNESPVTTKVMLKFLKNKDAFLNEISIRNYPSFDSNLCMKVLESFNTYDKFVASELQRFLYLSEFSYILVMPLADMSMMTYISKYSLEDNTSTRLSYLQVKNIFLEIIESVAFCHANKFAHANINLSHIVFHHNRWKLISFSSCVNIEDNQSEVTLSSKTGVISGAGLDIQSLGILLHELCLCTLDGSNIDTNINFSMRIQKIRTNLPLLETVLHRYPYKLISLLLSTDPKRTPSIENILHHPFINRSIDGYIDENRVFNLFLSYRAQSDYQNAEKIFDLLSSSGISIWWDKVCLQPGEAWEEGFCNGLLNSKVYLPILSSGSIRKSSISGLRDNFLLEQMLALEFKARGLIDFIYPIMLGDLRFDVEQGTYSYGNFFLDVDFSKLTNIGETKVLLDQHLRRLSLGDAYLTFDSAYDVCSEIMKYQGKVITGDTEDAIKPIIPDLGQLLKKDIS